MRSAVPITEPAEVPTMTSAVRASQPRSDLEGGEHPGVVRLANDPAGAEHESDAGHGAIPTRSGPGR